MRNTRRAEGRSRELPRQVGADEGRASPQGDHRLSHVVIAAQPPAGGGECDRGDRATHGVLLQAATAGRGTAAEAILFRQLGRLSVALLDAHKAVGDARRAEQMSESLRGKLAAIQERLPAVATRDAAGEPARALTPEEEAVRRAQRGLATPGTRSPLPNPITPRKRSTSDTSRDRDGTGRE